MQFYFCAFASLRDNNLVISKKIVFLPRCFVIQRRHVKSPASMFLVINFNISFHDWHHRFSSLCYRLSWELFFCSGLIFSLFRGITLPFFPYLPPVPRAGAQGPSPSPDCVRYADLSGVTEISPLRGELLFCNSQKYGAIPKLHAVLQRTA